MRLWTKSPANLTGAQAFRSARPRYAKPCALPASRESSPIARRLPPSRCGPRHRPATATPRSIGATRQRIRAKGKRRFKVTTDSKHDLPISPNLLNREFTVTEPDKVWAGDLTYIATDQGWLFLAVVIDLFSRQVVGWSLRPDMTRDIVIDALRMAWFKRHPRKRAGLIFHSDRGSQYASKDFRDVLTEYGITSSMSRKGNCWDNACGETLFGSLKVERLHGQRFETRRQAKDETIA